MRRGKNTAPDLRQTTRRTTAHADVRLLVSAPINTRLTALQAVLKSSDFVSV